MSQVDSWEDHVSAYLNLREYDNISGWFKVDILKSLYKKFGESSLIKFANEVGEPFQTVSKYLRLAEAYPEPEKRSDRISITGHYVAIAVDYNPTTKGINGENRFKVLEEAEDRGLTSVRQVAGLAREHQNQNQSELDKTAQAIATQTITHRATEFIEKHFRFTENIATFTDDQYQLSLNKELLKEICRRLQHTL